MSGESSKCKGRARMTGAPLPVERMSAEEQKWKSGLTPIQEGLYFEGIVKDLDPILELHKQETVSTFGCRTSYRTKVCLVSSHCQGGPA